MFQAAGADFASPLLKSQCTTVAFESVNAVKTVDRSNRPKQFFPGLRSFFRTPKRFTAMRERRMTSHSDRIVSEYPGVDVDR